MEYLGTLQQPSDVWRDSHCCWLETSRAQEGNRLKWVGKKSERNGYMELYGWKNNSR